MPVIFTDPSPVAVALFTLALVGLAAGIRNLVKDLGKSHRGARQAFVHNVKDGKNAAGSYGCRASG